MEEVLQEGDIDRKEVLDDEYDSSLPRNHNGAQEERSILNWWDLVSSNNQSNPLTRVRNPILIVLARNPNKLG